MINYYAHSGEKNLVESKKTQTNSITLKSGSLEFVVKTCDKKFGKNNYNLYSFTNFNDNKTFKLIKDETCL